MIIVAFFVVLIVAIAIGLLSSLAAMIGANYAVMFWVLAALWAASSFHEINDLAEILAGRFDEEQDEL